MNTASSNNSNLEHSDPALRKSLKNWGNPSLSKNTSASEHPRIRLEANKSNSIERKGTIENRFLLRVELEDIEGSQDNLQAKRRQFKALFEAGLKR